MWERVNGIGVQLRQREEGREIRVLSSGENLPLSKSIQVNNLIFIFLLWHSSDPSLASTLQNVVKIANPVQVPFFQVLNIYPVIELQLVGTVTSLDSAR